MRKLKLALAAALPLALLLSACNEFKVDKRKNTPAPTSMVVPAQPPVVVVT
jgi:hypothetical protein